MIEFVCTHSTAMGGVSAPAVAAKFKRRMVSDFPANGDPSLEPATASPIWVGQGFKQRARSGVNRAIDNGDAPLSIAVDVSWEQGWPSLPSGGKVQITCPVEGCGVHPVVNAPELSDLLDMLERGGLESMPLTRLTESIHDLRQLRSLS